MEVGNPEIGICRPDARCRQTGGSLALSMSSNPHGHRWIRSRWPPLYGRRNGRPPHRPRVKFEKLEPGHVAEAGDRLAQFVVDKVGLMPTMGLSRWLSTRSRL